MKKIQFDGAAIPNPGEMGIGVVLIEDKRLIAKISQKLPDRGTNNIAEYTALLTGLTKALELGWKHILIEGDSKLVINQVKGAWKINKAHLKRLHARVIKELSKFDSYALNWIPRNKNSVADELASMRVRLSNPSLHQPLPFNIRIASLTEINVVYGEHIQFQPHAFNNFS